MRILRILGAFLLGLMISTTFAAGQTWEPLTNQPTFNPGVMLLLTDGTVIMHSEPNCLTCTTTDYSSWYKLTPDSNGSYVNGTWTQIASLPSGYAPLYFGSAVLPDGRVVVEGGEYNCASGSCNAVWTNQGAIYDPLKNTWTPVQPPKGWTTIGDAQSVILPNGTYMQANCCTKQQALFNPANLTWNAVGKGKFDINDEEGWTLLPNGKVLTVDAYVFQYDATGTNSEIYNPSSATWTSAGSTIVQLWDSCGGADLASYEVGPAVLRPDGTVFATGARQCCDPMAQCLPRARILADRATPRFTTRTAERGRLVRIFPAHTASPMHRQRWNPTATCWCFPARAASILRQDSSSNGTAPA